MTSWPDQPAGGQPPQTRRQARESERAAGRRDARRAGTTEPTPGGEIPDLTATAASAAGRPADTASDRPTIPATAFAEPGVLPPTRPHTAGGDDFDALLFAGAPASQESPADAGDDASGLFRQAADPAKPQAVTQPLAVVDGPPAPAGTSGSATPGSVAATPASVAVPGSAAGSIPADPSAPAGVAPERTLTRRELRAMMQAQEANQQANHTPQPAEPIVPVTFTPPAAPADAKPPAAEETPADGAKTAWPFAPLTPSSGAQAEAPEAHGSSATAVPPVRTSAAASPFASLGLAPAPGATAGAQTPAPAADPAETAQERRPFTPPTGHWSTAADVEDESEPIISRNVGQSTAATTTNALILPAIPRPDATAPLTSTGEILVTGSIDLPRGVGATGLNPEHLDSSDIDNLLDGEENEFNTSEVAPVRASRAISTHTSTRGVITPPKKRGNALPTVLIITAGVLAVGVIGLLVAAYWLKVF
ncbi:hypothetical protein IT072_09965 [Leifsonia sp. ZF2019]|uniref:hypothetical protein n=1 Tax=Leifsonia sp. ZF2019 TaxID=2781978 RepID=UPI001CBE8A00|nr:hypothetical protein [Leifsonia sp. ZF2019]UAJ81269.1 hypothetical protein IT072_09965 [Leifsonia sp. ZF2019]